MNEIHEKLRDATYDLFPKTGAWSSDCFNQSEDSLIAHLRNTEWLTKRLKEKLPDVDIATIRAFVSDSEFFREQRENYEQLIVKWQIEYMMNGGDNWLVKEEYGGDFINFDERCDIGFRRGILDTLLAIGMYRDAIEEGIERNANLWRDSYMKRAFRNRYEPIDLFTRRSDKPFENTKEGHLEKWLKLRRYQYYQDHQESVDAYGIQKNGMDINSDELEALTVELALLDQERMQYLSEWKENSTIVLPGLGVDSDGNEVNLDYINKTLEAQAQVLPTTVGTQTRGIRSLIKSIFTGKK